MKIAVAGTGYVGLALATLLSQHNEVVAFDIVKEKVDMINSRISPIKDREIEDYLKNKNLNLRPRYASRAVGVSSFLSRIFPSEKYYLYIIINKLSFFKQKSK